MFKGKNAKDYGIGKFIGGFTAWGYWFAWNPVLAILALLIGNYLHGMVFAMGNIPVKSLSMVAGLVIFTALILINLWPTI